MVEKWYQYGHFYWLAFAIFFFFYTRAISIGEYRNSEIVKGVVVQHLEKRGRLNRTIYYPQYSFTYNDTLRYNADYYERSSRYYIGRNIKVIIPNGNPSNAKIYTFVWFWLERVQLLYCFVIAVLLFMFPAIARNFSHDITSKSK
jgi:hypothetical protein